jgi:hypothetical protein
VKRKGNEAKQSKKIGNFTSLLLDAKNMQKSEKIEANI